MPRTRSSNGLRSRRAALLAVAAIGLTFAVTGVTPQASASVSPGDSSTPTNFNAWTSLEDFALGHTTGGATLTDLGGGAITLRPGASYGTWVSPAYQPGFGITELVASWQAATPKDSWITTQLSVQVGNRWSPWFTMGKWAFTDEAIERTSVPDQNDRFGYISIDTYFSHSGEHASAYRLREQLYGDAQARPTIRESAAIAFAPQRPNYHVSETTMTRTVDLKVPQYSQETHHGEYARYGGGGEAWCSPTSTEMVVEYWGKGPSKADIKSLPPNKQFDAHGRLDGAVDWAAIHTYDKNYDGTGNWPFNAAYAAHYGLDGTVRQFDSLQGLEFWVKQGVPSVVSIAWNNKSKNPHLHLDGADIDSTGGHLIVVRGFTKSGDVIANDPASPDNDAVRHVYRRDQFEYLWQRASAGVVYLIKPYGITGKQDGR